MEDRTGRSRRRDCADLRVGEPNDVYFVSSGFCIPLSLVIPSLKKGGCVLEDPPRLQTGDGLEM